tara:strand:+ start:3357 stop:4337 length:981 start_codon:yes stop_codon:yes gene_type:complete
MKVLVTGGLGFIGSNFILKLLDNSEYSVVNIDAELQGSNHSNLTKIENSKNYSFVKGNITNKKLMEKLISENDVVVNFAAESFVDKSILDTNPFLVSNIRGTYTILEVIKEQKKKLLQISTDEVYGSLKSNFSAEEDTRFNPSSPYAATKAAAELLINSYNITYNCDTIITRCTNNYGPRQYPEKLIPKIILLANQNKKIPIYGNGKNIRDWLFVDDHCDAIIKVLNSGISGESYNISANNEIDNMTVVKKILEIMNKSENLIEFVEDRPGHDMRYSLDSTKIRTQLSWKEKNHFDNGIKKTIEWYLDNIELYENNLDTNKKTPWK